MKSRQVVRGTPINFVGPAGAFIGNREGFNKKMIPDGFRGGATTVANQFEGDQNEHVPARGPTVQQSGQVIKHGFCRGCRQVRPGCHIDRQGGSPRSGSGGNEEVCN